MRYIIILCLFVGLSQVRAQIGTSQSLHLSDSLRVWSCIDLDAYTYNVITLTNRTGANLDVTFRYAPVQPSRLPSAWHLQVEYPNSGGYTDTLHGSFRLDGANQQARLFFGAVLPNAQAGHDTMRLVMHPTADPTDSVEALFVLSVTPTTGIDRTAEAAAIAIKLWPNPASHTINISRQAHIEAPHIEICNGWGQVILRTQFSENTIENQIDISNFSAGSYWAIIRNDKGQIIDNQTFVKL